MYWLYYTLEKWSIHPLTIISWNHITGRMLAGTLRDIHTCVYRSSTVHKAPINPLFKDESMWLLPHLRHPPCILFLSVARIDIAASHDILCRILYSDRRYPDEMENLSMSVIFNTHTVSVFIKVQFSGYVLCDWSVINQHINTNTNWRYYPGLIYILGIDIRKFTLLYQLYNTSWMYYPYTFHRRFLPQMYCL